MAKIVGVRECLGVILYGRYLSGPWGCSLPEEQRFGLPFDFFVHSGYRNMNFDTDSGVVPHYHGYRLCTAGVYADTDDAALRSLLSTVAEIDFTVQERSEYRVSGLRLGEHTLLPRSDALAELRGEDVVLPAESKVSFMLGGPVALETAVRDAAERGAYTELLGWASGLCVRNIL